MYGRTPCGGDFMAEARHSAVDLSQIPARERSGTIKGQGRGPTTGGTARGGVIGPHANLSDGRGGARILGTIHDFTFSIAHYYTYQDITGVRAKIISPTPAHLAWDLGRTNDPRTGQPWADNLISTPFGTQNTANPWGTADPFASRMVSSGANAFGRGTVGTVGGAERDVRSTVEYERIQLTGGSLSFPVNALTGMFVGSDNPLYYLYTTFRSEIVFAQNVPTMRAWAHGDGATAFGRFLGDDTGVPGGPNPPAGYSRARPFWPGWRAAQ